MEGVDFPPQGEARFFRTLVKGGGLEFFEGAGYFSASLMDFLDQCS